MNYQEESLRVHEEKKGKIAVRSKVKVETKDDLSLAYTPGVAEPCRYIAKNKEDVYKYTFKGNSVAVISDGSAVLGLGNIGAEASLPVMEGKAILFKEFADIDAFPICLASQDVEKNIETIKNIVPVFGGINLEDFKAPQCFEIEAALQDLGIPVMHDDQHGTAVVVMAAMINALKVVGKNKEDVKVIVNGAGAAGIAVTKLLVSYGISSKNVILCDSKGTIYSGREDLENNKYKKELAEITNSCKVQGNLSDAIKGADVFLGVSKKGLLKKEMVESMNKDAIVLAMANPDPEIMPDEAKEAGARVIATGRSDFPNQVNNVLGFPGIFRGALDVRATRITEKMKVAAAEALASIVESPSEENIIPYALDKSVVPKVAEAVKQAWLSEN
ncbi:NAD-dependent malic enzyme [Candidatus Woesearchaeota archaeon]|nr:NAD-dependent malic enzyme [Candidatus Woesearchaeota archaeon]MBT3537948.1 NAD-dependent malic enzyme [Candidatus Woesearchaeota archaeon]MBT4717023.1 NAD-dependent malic enzyme [Candidatus Woesearchaeota archaeon]MBT7105617.1 NAD-dependent malic enzyme [Candidatus Woesearchaeota archaeon]MBT7931382.1 NAD-dependent malic enzyme [Candidatus Woesearchaeota archaeon]